MKKLIVLAGICAAILSGCSTISDMTGGSESAVDTRPVGPNGERLNRIPGTNPIEILHGLTDAQALDAVESAIRGTKPGERRNHWVSQWRIEDRDPANKWIRINLTARNHYLCVCWRIEGGKLVPDVPTSTNLKQDGIKIHRKVPAWINGLQPLISQKMYDMSQKK